MQQRVLTIVLLIGLSFGLLSLGRGMTSWRLPDREQGYAPVQPIDYSHRLHAGELGIDCRFCHWASDHGRYAGIPSSDICMKCHDLVTMPWDQLQKLQQDAAEKTGTAEAKTETSNRNQDATTDENVLPNKLLPLYESLGLDAAAKPIDGAKPRPIRWVRVHNLPDYVYFNHSAHLAVGVTCQQCHGPVESMERVRQFESLSMGWCLNCHRESTQNGIGGRVMNAPTNCAACHY